MVVICYDVHSLGSAMKVSNGSDEVDGGDVAG